MKNDVEKVRKQAEKFFVDSPGSHDWSHTERVLALCKHIGEKEGADPRVLELAALLHDVGRQEEDASKGKVCHAEKGSRLARQVLEREGFDAETTDAVVHCIESHRFRKNKPPQSIEARVLFDADKLDAIGAVGVGRAFLFAGQVGAALHDPDVDIEKTREYSKDDTAYREYLVKLRHLKDRMLTKEGKRLAQERHDFMAAFFERLNKEAKGVL